MKHLHKRSVWVILYLLASSVAQAQTNTIKGKILTSDTKQPLFGAAVNVKGTEQAVLSTTGGTFEIKKVDNATILVISYTGYVSKTVTIGNNNFIEVFLELDNKQLDEVVVTGYGTQNKKFIAGSVSNVKGEELRNNPVAGFNQLLQGKTTGVQVLSNSGVPGGGVTFRVRGTNSINASSDPLYIIDGVFVSNADPIQTGLGGQQQSNPIADLNVEDIDNITILKDASATAIYGSLGANGVILVTTKRGKLNAKGRITFNSFQGISTAINKFKVTNGPETALLTNESRANTAADGGPVVAPLPDVANQPTFDRVNDLFRNALTSNYDLAIRGGSEKSTYYLSLGYLKQESIVKPSDFERYTARFNYDNFVTQQFKAGTSVGITRTTRNVSSNDNNPRGVINSALYVRSYLPVLNPNGTYARYGAFDNHIALIDNLNNDAVGWRTIANLYGEYSFSPSLKLKSSFSVDNNSAYENNYTNTLLVAGVSTNGTASSFETKNIVLTNEQVLTFAKSLGAGKQHNINVLVGNTINSVLNQNTSATGNGFASNDLTAISVAAIRTGSSSRSQAKLISFFGKANYTYKNKYTFDASIRADASSRFGTNNQWGYFPSAGFTWRAIEEDFIKNLGWFNNLKIRGSVGVTGNQNGIDPYGSKGLWNSGSNYLEQAGTGPSQIANPDLTWESTTQYDVGIDFSIFNKKLDVSLDYYNKYTRDLLLSVPVPSRTGFTSYFQNFGAVSNKGVELSLRSTNINNNQFKWTTEFNISHNKNNIERLASDIALGASGRNISILKQGFPVNSFQLYKQLFVDPQTGNAVYEDVNKDGLITAADRQIVGNALPIFTGGITNNFTYKNFDANFFIYYQEGNKIMNMNDFFLVHGNTQANIGFVPRQLDRWQKPGDITDIPRLTTFSGNPTANNSAANNYGGNVANLSSRYLEDASFIRLKTVSVGYNFSKEMLKRVKLNNLRMYVQATNLFTITNYGGLDPEVSAQSSNSNTAGYDWATVPQPKTYQIGLTVTF